MGAPAESEEASQEIISRLDYIAQILQVAFAPQLDTGRQHLRSDPIAAEIFDRTAGTWRSSGDLQRDLAKATGKGTSTIRERLTELAQRGLLEQRGEARNREYRSAGLV
jgi:hypothetical protein